MCVFSWGVSRVLTLLGLVSRRAIRAAFKSRQRGAVLTTHYMEEAEAVCDRVAIMVSGQLRSGSASPRNAIQTHTPHAIQTHTQ